MPFPLLAALSIGVPLVTNVLRGHDVGEANKKNRKAIALANLQNALNPRAQHDPNLQDVQPSLLTRVAEGANMGLGAYNAFNSLTAAAKAQATQQQAAELAIKEAEDRMAQQQGQQLFARQQVIQAPEAARQLDVVSQGPTAANLPKPSFLSGVSQAQMAAAQPVGGAQTQGFVAAQTAARDAAAAARRQGDQDLRAQQEMALKVRAEEEARRANLAAERQRTEEMRQRDQQERARIAATLSINEGKHNEPPWFTQKANALQTRLQTNPQLGMLNEYTDGLSGVVNGIAQGNGMGILNAIKGLARLGSPGAVQQGEVVTQENAQGWLAAKIGKVEGIFSGNTVSEDGQRRMLELAMELYNTKMAQVNGLVDKQYAATAQGVDPEWSGPLRAYAEPYRLPSPDELIPESTWERLQKRYPTIGGGSSVTGAAAGTDSLSAFSDTLNAAYQLLGQGRR